MTDIFKHGYLIGYLSKRSADSMGIQRQVELSDAELAAAEKLLQQERVARKDPYYTSPEIVALRRTNTELRDAWKAQAAEKVRIDRAIRAKSDQAFEQRQLEMKKQAPKAAKKWLPLPGAKKTEQKTEPAQTEQTTGQKTEE